MEQMQQETENKAVQEVKIDNPEAVLNALNKANAEAKKFREEKEKLQADLENKSQIVADYSSKLIKEKVKSQLELNGIKDTERFFKFIDINGLSIGENGELNGFDSQFDTLKSDFPEIFDAKLRVGGQADSASSISVSTKISASELQARKILGRF